MPGVAQGLAPCATPGGVGRQRRPGAAPRAPPRDARRDGPSRHPDGHPASARRLRDWHV